MSYVTDPRWLLLAHQLPTRPSNARVKTWRRLQQIGAVPTRNSVYVLPNTEQSREDFEWIRSEIVALGGGATVFAASALNSEADDDIVAAFQRPRDIDYRTLKRDAEKLLTSARRKPTASAPRRDVWSRAVRGLRERFNEIERVDFFHAPARQGAADALGKLERKADAGLAKSRRIEAPVLSVGNFRSRQWVTRPRPGVDRMASAWLIRRYIDSNATFAFVETPGETDVPFDMYVGDFSHEGSSCTFETLAQRFALTDTAVMRIGQIVHDLDMKETRFAPVEAPAVGRMVDGLRELYPDDPTLLEHGISIFEALARSFTATGNKAPRPGRARHTRKGRRR